MLRIHYQANAPVVEHERHGLIASPEGGMSRAAELVLDED